MNRESNSGKPAEEKAPWMVPTGLVGGLEEGGRKPFVVVPGTNPVRFAAGFFIFTEKYIK
jgi:hypothetical protein